MKFFQGLLVLAVAFSFVYSDSGVLTEDERKSDLVPLLTTGWHKTNGRDAIYKEFKFPSFNQAFGFISRIALMAEKMDHHPELFNSYNEVNITLFSFDVQGISGRDIKMAKFINSIEH